MTDSYPRPIVGYGADAPDARWPNGARIAVSLVLNYEEGGEYCILHGDAHSEYVLTDVGADPLTGARNMNIESQFEYGSRVGVWEVMRVLRERQVQPTVYAVGMALERNAPLCAEVARYGWEVACHGYRWIDYQFVDEATERDHMRLNVEAVTRLIGRRPLGWYTGRPSPNTRKLLSEFGGFLYDSDAYNDDLPYWSTDHGAPHLIIPHAFDTNDSRLQRGGDFGTGDQWFTYCRDTFDWLYEQGRQGRARMMTVSLHARIIGRPGRLGSLAKLLDYIQDHEKVWLCSRSDIARHWIEHHPAAVTRS